MSFTPSLSLFLLPHSSGGRHITQRIKEEMHAFWAALEWLANTILFIWVGIALGFVLLEPANPALRLQEIKFAHHLSATDAGWAVVLYLWLLVRSAPKGSHN